MSAQTIMEARGIRMAATMKQIDKDIPVGHNKIMIGFVLYIDKEQSFDELFDRMQGMLMKADGVTLVTAVHQTKVGPEL